MSDKLKLQAFLYAGTNMHMQNDVVPLIDVFGDKAEANGKTVAKFIKKHCSNSFVIGMMKFFSEPYGICRICLERDGDHIGDGIVICKKCKKKYI